MANELNGKRVGILFTDGVEQVELEEPRRALRDAGARIDLLSIKSGPVQAMNHADKGETVTIDRTVDRVDLGDYDALVLPGGVNNPDKLRMNDGAVDLVRRFFDAGKPIAVICHGPWTLVEADVVRGVTLTSYPSLQTDIRNAGGNWVDREVVVDHNIVSSRNPNDLPAFCTEMVRLFSRGRAEEQGAEKRVA